MIPTAMYLSNVCTPIYFSPFQEGEDEHAQDGPPDGAHAAKEACPPITTATTESSMKEEPASDFPVTLLQHVDDAREGGEQGGDHVDHHEVLLRVRFPRAPRIDVAPDGVGVLAEAGSSSAGMPATAMTSTVTTTIVGMMSITTRRRAGSLGTDEEPYSPAGHQVDDVTVADHVGQGRAR